MNRIHFENRGRRRLALRRLFFLLCITISLASVAWRQTDAAGQEDSTARIATRLARVMRDDAGHIRIIESLTVIPGDSARGSRGRGPLTLVQLSSVTDVRVLGGDLGPQQVVFDPPDLMIVDSVGPGEVQVVITYVVTTGVKTFQFAAQMPVDEFVLEVQRGSVTAKPGPQFQREGEAGSATRPFRRYVAHGLSSGRAAEIEFVSRHVDWRQRLAVLIGTATAIVGVMIWVWRRDATDQRSARRAGVT